MDPGDFAALAVACEKVRKRPSLIHQPELGFFKEYLLTFGVQLPGDEASGSDVKSGSAAQIDLSDSDDVGATKAAKAQGGLVADSDEEDSQRLPEDLPPFPELPPPRIEDDFEEADVQACAAAREAADAALEEGDLGKAVDKLTEALLTGAAPALAFARRGEILLRQGRPCAAMSDCKAALEINPECGKAFRVRGMAARALGRWEAALQDLAHGQKLDYDEAVEEVHKFVAEKAEKLAGRQTGAGAQVRAIKRRKAR